MQSLMVYPYYKSPDVSIMYYSMSISGAFEHSSLNGGKGVDDSTRRRRRDGD